MFNLTEPNMFEYFKNESLFCAAAGQYRVTASLLLTGGLRALNKLIYLPCKATARILERLESTASRVWQMFHAICLANDCSAMLT